MDESPMNDQPEERRGRSVVESEGGRPDVKRDVSDLDPSLLAYLADDIEIAHGVNPNSWALYRVATGAVILVVHTMTVIGVSTDRGGVLVLGDPDSPMFQSVDHARVQRDFKNFPGFLISADSAAHLGSTMEEFRVPHHEGISRLASSVKTHTQRAVEHQPVLLNALSSVVGRVLPQPAYAEELRNQRLREGDDGGRPTIKRDVSDLDQSLLAHLANDIETAHRTNPNSWSCYRMKTGGVVLAIESIAVTYVSKSRGGILVLGDLDSPTFQSVDHARVKQRYKYFPGFWIDADSTARLGEDMAEFRTPHHEGIAHLASTVKTHSQRAHDHQPATLDALSSAVGRVLPQPAYMQALRGAASRHASNDPGVSTGSVVDAKSAIRNQFFATGLHYTDAQVAAFYTSLQTKGFVVLSGISGTGKSKIATGFAEMLPSPAATAQPAADIAGMISISVKPYMRTYKRIILPNRQVDLLPPLGIGTQTDVRVSAVGIHGSGRIEHRAHTGASSITVLYLRGEVARAFATLDVGTRLYVRPTLGDDGDAIESVELLRPEELIRNELQSDDIETSTKHLFLSVRPDWRDSTSLLGYYNPLTQTYEWTEFLHFLLRAQESYAVEDGYAWFVIFDEMNLAHVEYYFADLLSVIESGRDREGWTREPLRLTYPNTLDDDVPPHELRLPPNLYIIGTVNMDETTHAFSPKVLDRAFTIELTDVNFSDYVKASVASDHPMLTDSEMGALLTAFTREGRFALIDKTEIGDIVAKHPRILADLEALNGVLQHNRMHFGYRVFDEICQYLFNNDLSQMMNFEDAFDQAVFMKVLPKFNGSRARLQSPLQGVLAWAVDPHRTSSSDVNAVTALFNAFYAGTATDAWTGEPAFPAVARRARDMLVALERDGFVSFG